MQQAKIKVRIQPLPPNATFHSTFLFRLAAFLTQLPMISNAGLIFY
jgi:hypothetical protein